MKPLSLFNSDILSQLCNAVAHAAAQFLISVKSFIAFCFQLNVVKSSFFRYQSALLVAAQSLVFIEV